MLYTLFYSTRREGRMKDKRILLYGCICFFCFPVYASDLSAGFDTIALAATIAQIVGICICGIGLVISAIRYMNDDAGGGKDILQKSFIGLIIMVCAVIITRFIIGSFKVDFSGVEQTGMEIYRRATGYFYV
jgi:amino acid transporter